MSFTKFQALAAFGILLLGTAPASQASLYQVDDGVSEYANGIGSFNGADFIALNQFTVIGGNNMIGSVSVAWGSPAVPNFTLNGLSYTAVIWSDPNGDGDPTDAQVLGTASATISNANTDTFNVSVFPTCVTVTRSFFVGFIITYGPSPNPGRITAFDMSSPLANRSFITGASANTGNIYDLSATGGNSVPLHPVEFYGAIGNWLIRADPCVAVPEPTTLGLAIVGGLLGLFGWRSRRSRRLSRRSSPGYLSVGGGAIFVGSSSSLPRREWAQRKEGSSGWPPACARRIGRSFASRKPCCRLKHAA